MVSKFEREEGWPLTDPPRSPDQPYVLVADGGL